MPTKKSLAKERTMRVLNLTSEEYDYFEALGEKIGRFSSLTLDEELSQKEHEITHESIKNSALACIEMFAITGDNGINLIGIILDTIALSLVKKAEANQASALSSNDQGKDQSP